ncbi:MAG: hypothetical protein HOP19_11545, partial [Acidobacteria bacterium]|nr:hypothetical protein [Acidobacteriota bacterium]
RLAIKKWFDDADEAAHGGGVFHRSAAEFHDDHKNEKGLANGARWLTLSHKAV